MTPTSLQFQCITLTLSVVYAEPSIQAVAYNPSDDTRSVDQLSQYSQCTRRFTPGVCSDSVSPVWTFMYQLQNCTERLGCPDDSDRTNRFKSYELCMSKCRALVDLYLQILSYDAHKGNSSEYQQEGLMGLTNGNSSRRDAMEAQYNKDVEASSFSEAPQASDVKIEELEDESIPSMTMYRDSLDVETDDVFPPDIDYVLGGNDSG